MRRLVPGTAAVLLVAVAVTWWWQQQMALPPVNAAEQTIFGLPFRHSAPSPLRRQSYDPGAHADCHQTLVLRLRLGRRDEGS